MTTDEWEAIRQRRIAENLAATYPWLTPPSQPSRFRRFLDWLARRV